MIDHDEAMRIAEYWSEVSEKTPPLVPSKHDKKCFLLANSYLALRDENEKLKAALQQATDDLARYYSSKVNIEDVLA
jgi:hypothetical protein